MRLALRYQNNFMVISALPPEIIGANAAACSSIKRVGVGLNILVVNQVNLCAPSANNLPYIIPDSV